MRFTMIICWICWSLGAIAQEADFYARVDRNPVGLKETFTLEFHFVNTKSNTWKAPDLSNFEIISGPNRSSSVQIVNGDMTQETILSYILRPNSLGKFTIGQATATIEGQSYHTKPIQLEVVQGRTQKKQKRDPWSDPFGFGFSTPSFPTQPHRQGNNQNAHTNIKLLVYADRNSVYKGQQTTLTYKLLVPSNVGVNDYSQPAASYDGFWKQDIKLPKQQVKQERINGQIYRSIVIQKVALFPQKSGDLTIAPTEIQAIQSQGFFNQVKVKVKSNALTIHVKALPLDNMPASFSGAVGDFKLYPYLSDTLLTTDDAITYRIKISGTGNLNLIQAPEINMPADFEVYDPKTSLSLSGHIPVSGSKSFEYLIIPRRAGRFSIDPIEFSYFNPNTERYISLKTPAYKLHISGNNKENDQQSVSGISREEVELLGKDIRFIETGPSILAGNTADIYSKTTLIGLVVSPFLLFVGLIMYKKQRDKKRQDISGRRIKGAARMATKRLAKAKKLMLHNDEPAFYKELNQSLWGFLADRQNLPISDLSKEKIEILFSEQQIDKELYQSLKELFDICETALYAPASVRGNMKKWYDKSVSLIEQLNKQMKV